MTHNYPQEDEEPAWGQYFDIIDKIEDEREDALEQAKAEEDYRHAEKLATEALRRLERRANGEFPYVFVDPEEVAALRFLTGIPRERK